MATIIRQVSPNFTPCRSHGETARTFENPNYNPIPVGHRGINRPEALLRDPSHQANDDGQTFRNHVHSVVKKKKTPPQREGEERIYHVLEGPGIEEGEQNPRDTIT